MFCFDVFKTNLFYQIYLRLVANSGFNIILYCSSENRYWLCFVWLNSPVLLELLSDEFHLFF